ncbi:MAG: PAS domain S-box protein [Chloroherpetonaceae bacterium]|nr:PAS domain S-box protein [Chloroherpetonaceae bacterium]
MTGSFWALLRSFCKDDLSFQKAKALISDEFHHLQSFPQNYSQEATDSVPQKLISQNENFEFLSEKHFRTAFEVNSSFLYRIRVNENEISLDWISENSIEMIGYSMELIFDKRNWNKLIYEPDLPIISDIIQRVIKGEETIAEFRIVKEDGQLCWVEDRVKPVLNEEGKVVFAYGSVTDIHAKKTAEAELKNKEQLLRLTYDNTPIGLCLTDENGKFVEVNKAYCDTYGYTREELIGKHFTLVIPSEEKLKYQNIHSAFIAGEKNTDGEWLLIRKDGALRNIHVKASLYQDFNGARFKVTSVQDITNHKIDHLKLESQRLKLLAFFNSSSESIFLIDREFQILGFNQVAQKFIEKLFGVKLEEGHSMLNYAEPKTKEGFIKHCQEAFEGKIIETQIEIPFPNFTRWWSVEYIPVKDEMGKVFCIAFCSKDVTTFVHSQNELNEKNRYISSIGDNLPNTVLYQFVSDRSGNGRFTFISQGIEKISGFTTSELYQEPNKLKTIFHPEDVSQAMFLLEESAKSLNAFELRVRKGINQVFDKTSLFRVVPRLGDNGEIIWDAIESDITAIIEAQVKQRQHELSLYETEELANIGNWEIDLNQSIIRCSPVIKRIFESEGESTSCPLNTFYKKIKVLDREKVESSLQMSILKNISFSFEVELDLPSERECWIRFFGKPFVQSNGVKILKGYIQEITNDKLFQKEITESQLFLQSIYYGINTPIFVIEVERENQFRVIGLNPAHEKVIGVSNQLLTNKKIDELDSVFSNEIIQRLKARYQACVDAKDEMMYEEEVEINHQKKYFLTSLSPIINSSGKVIRIIGNSLDITYRKVTEKLLISSQSLLSDTEKIAHIGGWRYPLEKQAEQMIFWSNETYQIFDREIDRGEPSLEELVFMHIDLKDELKKMIDAAISKAIPYEFETRIHTGKQIKWIYSVAKVKTDSNGRVTELYGYVMDITKRKIAELEKEKMYFQLVQSQKMESLGVLASGVAHEFNNILAGILGYATLLKKGFEPESKELKRVEHIIANSNRAASIVRQMLGFARQGKYESSKFNMKESIDEVLQILEPTLDRRIKIETRVEENLPLAFGDKAQIEQVILNLAVNAIDAIQERLTQENFQGQLIFELALKSLPAKFTEKYGLRPVGKFLQLSLKDNGNGIPEEISEKIFEPFYTTKKPGKGTGLGLAMSYGIMKNHSGFIFHESVVGSGTTFYLYIPLAEKNENIHSSSLSSRPLSINGRNLLIVEDEAFIRDFLNDTLTMEGAFTTAVSDGVKGVQEIEANPNKYDAVILDMNMPELNGYDAFVKMKKINPNLKFLFMTGYLENEEISRLKAEGVTQIIRKPFEIEALIQSIAETIS